MMGWLQALIQRISNMKKRWIGVLVGSLLWVFWMLFGFWYTLLFIVLAGIGYTVGRVLEERLSWKQVVDKLLSEHFGD